jgi:hypothetical protein
MNLARRFNAGTAQPSALVASATADKTRISGVASATRTTTQRFPALKRRAKFIPPLRVEELCSGAVEQSSTSSSIPAAAAGARSVDTPERRSVARVANLDVDYPAAVTNNIE